VTSVRAHWLLVLAVITATTLAGVSWSASRSPTYEASAQVLLTPLSDTSRAFTRVPLLVVSSDRARLAQTAANLLDSPAAAAATARAAGEGWTATRVASAIDVQPEGGSDVLSVTARAGEPAVAARLANQFARAALDARNGEIRGIVRPLIRETERDLSAVSDPSSAVAVDLAERLGDLRPILAGGDPTLSFSRPAVPPTSAVGPSSRLLALLSVLSGIAVGIGSALIIDAVRPRRIADGGDAVAQTGLPVLARVPTLSPLQRVRAPLVTFRPAAATGFRMLQHQLALQLNTHRCILLAGVSPRDGVTTSVAELGLTLGRAGHDVLLVDVDTREPQLAARLGVKEPLALSDVSAPEDAVASVPDAPNVMLLAVGRHELMGIPDDIAADLPAVLEDARNEFDYVLLDAPPLAESSEALQVVSAVDAVVLVLRPGSTRVADLETVLGMLDRAGRRPDGILLVGGHGPGAPSAPAGLGLPRKSASAAAPVTRTAET
jgi:succinoglycan biosynthesis transport protein ExoP